MSVYLCIYIGVYIEVECNTKTVDTFVNICPKGCTQHYPSAKFCVSCGTELIQENRPKSSFISCNNLIDDELLPIGYDDFNIIDSYKNNKEWVVQNLIKGKYGGFYQDSFGANPIPSNTEELIDDFTDEFAELISSLKKHCESVKICYGMISYHN